MPINADKPHLWKADTRASVDQFNQWFMKFAPKAYRDTRKKTIESVEQGLALTKDLTTITPDVIKANPGILPTLRMSTCPPLARDRLIGLADSTKNLVGCLEEGKLPPHLAADCLGRTSQEDHRHPVADAGRGYFSVAGGEAQTHQGRTLPLLHHRRRPAVRSRGRAHRAECPGEAPARTHREIPDRARLQAEGASRRHSAQSDGARHVFVSGSMSW